MSLCVFLLFYVLFYCKDEMYINKQTYLLNVADTQYIKKTGVGLKA